MKVICQTDLYSACLSATGGDLAHALNSGKALCGQGIIVSARGKKLECINMLSIAMKSQKER